MPWQIVVVRTSWNLAHPLTIPAWVGVGMTTPPTGLALVRANDDPPTTPTQAQLPRQGLEQAELMPLFHFSTLVIVILL